EKQLRAIEQKMALESSTDDASFQETLKEYTRLQEAFERQNGYGYRSGIKMVLHGFKFYEEDYDKTIAYLPGGQKTRLSLAQFLLEKKEVLILEEPPTHLEIETNSWLDTDSRKYTGARVMGSQYR